MIFKVSELTLSSLEEIHVCDLTRALCKLQHPRLPITVLNESNHLVFFNAQAGIVTRVEANRILRDLLKFIRLTIQYVGVVQHTLLALSPHNHHLFVIQRADYGELSRGQHWSNMLGAG